MHRGVCLISIAVLVLWGLRGWAEDYCPPKEVKVLAVFFVPKGERPPTQVQAAKLLRHLTWAQKQYKDMLKGRDTFTLVPGEPKVYTAEQGLAYYRRQPEGGAPQMVSELLGRYKYNRYNCPGIFVAIVINPQDDFPVGGGRPFNGGLNTGGGIVQMSSYALDRLPNFQSTLVHELGHAFGLPHVDVYRYEMDKNPSIMSYNKSHHARGFQPSPTPGTLIPEDLRALALNTRVFPRLTFNPAQDRPQDYSLAPRIICLGPMKIPGQPDGIQVTTNSGETYGSHVANIVQGHILPNCLPPELANRPGASTFDPRWMWHSDAAASGWVSAEVTFPGPVELTAVSVHSQHSGKYHIAEETRITATTDDGAKQIAVMPLKSADQRLSFAPTGARTWRFDFRAGQSQTVVLRGLRFFRGDEEIFPTLVPYPN